MVEEDNKNTEEEEQPTSTPSGGCVYDNFGRSPDKSTICGIGLPSAGADTGSGFQKCVFKNECPHCGRNTLKWAWNFGSTFEGNAEGGSTEGHFFCVQKDGGCDADYSAQGNEHINGSTYKMEMISGPTPSNEQEAQQLISGELPCDGSGTASTPNTSGSGGVGGIKIPDVTFYGLIKQIIGATDSMFIIANNMAYLIAFQDAFKYRDEYNEYIPKIEPSDVIKNSIEREWTTAGYYNNVELTYSEGTIEYGHDVLIKQYGKNTFYYDFPEDDYETAKSKAQALLAAHVRDYSTDIQLQIFYNENITEGSWVKLHKSLSKIDGKTRREQKQKDIKVKRKGITISNITEEIVKDKIIRHVTDEEGNKIDIESEKSDYDLFFVQGYNCRWNKHNALIMDIQLKYGPDTPSDPVSATIGSMGAGGTSSSSGAMNLSGDLGEMVKQWIQGATDDLSKAKAIHEGLKSYGIVYSKYNNFDCNSIEECLKNSKSPGLNCGDTAQLTTAAMKMAGLNAYFVLRCDSAHYFTVIEINGQKYYSDLTANEGQQSKRPWNEVWEGNTCGSKYTDCPTC